jgi:hypothetical protein
MSGLLRIKFISAQTVRNHIKIIYEKAGPFADTGGGKSLEGKAYLSKK